jgi:predicted nucleotidyltransferase
MPKVATPRTRKTGSRTVSRTTSSGSIAGNLACAVERIVRTLKPEKIVLFGSHARGTSNEDSDVDLLIVMDSTASERERYLSVCRLLRPRQFPVDIVVRTTREITEALDKGDFFLREILAEGKILYERHH